VLLDAFGFEFFSEGVIHFLLGLRWVLEGCLRVANIVPVEAYITPAACLVRCGIVNHGEVLIVGSGEAGACCTEGQSNEAEREEVYNVLFNFHTIIILGLGGKDNLKGQDPRSHCPW